MNASCVKMLSSASLVGFLMACISPPPRANLKSSWRGEKSAVQVSDQDSSTLDAVSSTVRQLFLSANADPLSALLA
jgi:hypothetical protein